MPDLAEVDRKLLQVGQSSEVFRLDLRLVEKHVRAFQAQDLGRVDLLVTGVDRRLERSQRALERRHRQRRRQVALTAAAAVAAAGRIRNKNGSEKCHEAQHF